VIDCFFVESMSKLAAEVGYNSESAFARAFRRRFRGVARTIAQPLDRRLFDAAMVADFHGVLPPLKMLAAAH
jgi:hypothetical protein